MCPLVLLILALFSHSALGDREKSLEVFSIIEKVQPEVIELQNEVFRKVADAKLSGTQIISSFESNIFGVKHEYVAGAINNEEYVDYQVASQSSLVADYCAPNIKQLIKLYVDITGLAYASCLNETDNKLRSEIRSFSQLVNVDESKYLDKIALLNGKETLGV